ncbi:MAG: hypothetical protein FWC10_00575 [Lentimicrobiaceae bacterium]|nr:hypothetical protein [Lentimicrobiaceae bacterium]
MKKIILIIFLGCAALFLHSCIKTCTCIKPNSNAQELEIDPSESCSAYSGEEWGECS